MDMDKQSQLVELIAQFAYKEGEFVLSSGQQSNFYLDVKQVTYRPGGANLVGELTLAIAEKYGANAVGGLTMGADAIVASTVVASQNAENPIMGFVVRKESKNHGLGKLIEGVYPKGMRVIVVDDVVTSGGSVLKAVDKARDAGAEVLAVVTVVDREEGGAEHIKNYGVHFEALCKISQVSEFANRKVAYSL